MKCADYTEPDVQNAFYEDYTCSVEVTNLFVFKFKGDIIHAAINFPGSWHDSKLATVSDLMHPFLSEKTPDEMALLADSAFTTLNTEGKVVRTRKSNENSGIPSDTHMVEVDLKFQSIMPSERQSDEWCIRAMKGPLGIFRSTLTPDDRKRYIVLATCGSLLNMRMRLVGRNQI